MKVVLPSPLVSYTAGRREVQAAGATLAEVLADLDRQFPGIRFRMIDEQDAIRQHIRIFVNREPAPGLAAALASTDEVLIIAALSGG
ncbi:MoaD/ThiS family protein [Usitatibacter palustris]|uniref:Sulfur carrier protein CysO n=1 Tax=Usitatibacter palustris TaxID=2732487 RepID=A0A6M4H4I9_9PROT|nr:MoaD/ThiS family protein [Usitatibacter palustris]QJR14539.1 Sulfur carrier protein CysO [Usitatibacter palustris]